ncbi:hypothetical protein E6O75_ATG01396 [Venturia nashicola]|uniref:Uncharacterized protein n=1 Tax=Venturia nashicola TaxID=86259 RepID=A0A4Z1PEF4_9PEZI|nr:hypothetical protein E6O75_ATG01396 [Venturia nashicola]
MSSYEAASAVTQTPRSTRPSFPEGGFLVLAPTLSSDYPLEASSQDSSIASTTAASPALSPATLPFTSAIDDSAPADAAQSVKNDRRSSSVSSSGVPRQRVLKLGPVHNGEVTVSDYVERDEE